MCVFKAIRCWLRKDMTKGAPKGWDKKRNEIDERIQNIVNTSKQEAVIEEIDTDEGPDHEKEEEDSKKPVVKNKGRLDIRSRHQDACKALEYNILRRHENDGIQSWKSYPGINEIIKIARDIIENNDIKILRY